MFRGSAVGIIVVQQIDNGKTRIALASYSSARYVNNCLILIVLRPCSPDIILIQGQR